MVDVTRLRLMVGWLAFALPWIVMILALAFGYGFPPSISATYYFDSCIAPFMIILGTASTLLMCYKGYDTVDDVLNTIAGILGLCICLFPCLSAIPFVGTFQLPVALSSIFHNISAVIFFAILAYVSLFQFTKTNGIMTEKKKIRNIIYRVCGIGMLVSFGILLLPDFWFKIWLTETFALAFFGVSWLTKADYYSWLAGEKQ